MLVEPGGKSSASNPTTVISPDRAEVETVKTGKKLRRCFTATASGTLPALSARTDDTLLISAEGGATKRWHRH